MTFFGYSRMMNKFLNFVWNGVFNLTGIDLSFDIRYRDYSFYLVELKADHNAVKKRFEDMKLVPIETSPGETRIQIGCLDVRDVQLLGPYKEMTIHVPVKTLDGSKTDTFAHLYLPVTSEAARRGGVYVNGLPKFIATIDIEGKNSVTECKLINNDDLILGFNLENHDGTYIEFTWDFYGRRKDKIIRTSFEFQGNYFESRDVGGSYLYFGTQKISEELKDLIVSDKVVKIAMGERMSGTLKKPIYVE